MKRKQTSTAVIFGSLVISILIFCPVISSAETDVTSKIQLIQSSMLYDRRTGTNYLDVSLKNVSQDTLLIPITIVIDNISDPKVTVANADGVTSGGKPYFQYAHISALFPSQSIDSKRWIFTNPNRARFTYNCSVWANIPEPAKDIGENGGIIGNENMVINIPPGALNSVRTISIVTNQDPYPFDNLVPGFTFLKKYDISAADNNPLTFDKVVEIVVPYQYDRVLAQYDEARAGIIILPLGRVDEKNQNMTFVAKHFSPLAELLVNVSNFINQEVTFTYWDDHLPTKANDLLVNNFGDSAHPRGVCAGISLFTSWFRSEYGCDNESSSFPYNTKAAIATQAQDEVSGVWDSLLNVFAGLTAPTHYYDLATLGSLYAQLAIGIMPTMAVGYAGLYWPPLSVHAVLIRKIEMSFPFIKLYVVDNEKIAEWNGGSGEKAYLLFSILESRFVDFLYDGSYPTWMFSSPVWELYSWERMRDIYRSFDKDGDRVLDDGDESGVSGDNPCRSGTIENCDDNCPNKANKDQADSDGDGVGDACDICPNTPIGAIVDANGCSENQRDMDSDGYPASVDCNDNDPTVYPGAPEICDGKDNDCNGQIDEGCGATEAPEISFLPSPASPIWDPVNNWVWDFTFFVNNPNDFPIEVVAFGEFSECLTDMASCSYNAITFRDWFNSCGPGSIYIPAKGMSCDSNFGFKLDTAPSTNLVGKYAIWYKDKNGDTKVALSPDLTLLKPSSGGTFAYIGNSLHNTVSVIDLDSSPPSPVAGSPISVGSLPYGVAVNPAGTRVYITNEKSGTVSVINTSTNTVIATIPIGSGTAPDGIVVNPAGTKVYVARFGVGSVGSRYVSVIDTSSNTVVNTITVGSRPVGVAINPSGTRLYVTNRDNNSVSVVNTNNDSVIATINVGSSPHGVAVNPSGTRVYVANMYGHTISVIDTSINTVIATIPISANPYGPYGVAVNPSGTRLYASGYSSNSVFVIDTSTNQVIKTIPVGVAPHGLSLNASGTRLYVVNHFSNNVSVIDTTTNTVIGSPISVGNRPIGLGNFIVDK